MKISTRFTRSSRLLLALQTPVHLCCVHIKYVYNINNKVVCKKWQTIVNSSEGANKDKRLMDYGFIQEQ